MRAQHDWRLLCRRQCKHGKVPGFAIQSIRDVAQHLSGEALLSIMICDAESDRILGVGNNREVPPVPTIRASVQRILALWIGR